MFKTKSIEEKTAKGYKVYKTPTEFVSVEAATAFEAIEKSGIKNPYKVEKQGIVHKTLFTDNELKDVSVQNSTTENKNEELIATKPNPDVNTEMETDKPENPQSNNS